MPIYRLNGSGIFQKLGKISRLNSSGIFQSLGVIYRLNASGIFQKIFSSAPDTVTQLTDPGNPSGTGEAFTSVSKGSAGTYSNYNTGYGVVTTLVKLPIGNTPTSNTETKYGTDISSPYTVTQADATTPVYRYWTESKVKNVAGTKTFYFYSSGNVQAHVGDITDNYNRTVASGLGTSSSSYIYSSYANSTATWSVNGSRAVNSSAVSSGAGASSHPLQTIEVGSSLSTKTNKTYSIDIPDGKGGQGVAFWTTAADSWYAVTSYFDYDTSTTTQVTCTATSTWTSPTTNSVTDCNNANTFGTSVGQRCGTCTYTGISYPCTGTSTYSTTAGSATINCENNVPTGSLAGDRCGSCSYTGNTVTYPCTGFVSGQASCPGTGNFAGDRCSTCTTSTSYPCSGGTVSSPTCPSTGSLSGDRCTACTAVINDGFCRSNSVGSPVCPSCPNGLLSTAQYDCSTGFSKCRCTTQTYTVRATATTYSYSIRQTLTTYNFSYPIRTTQYNFTYPSNQNETVTQYTYNTRMKIWSAVSGTVISQAWDNVGNSTGFITSATNTVTLDPSLYVGIYKITASTSGNTVTAIAYNAGGSQIGSTLTKTFASPTKSNANNETSAGVIKAYSAFNVGTLYDNLSIT